MLSDAIGITTRTTRSTNTRHQITWLSDNADAIAAKHRRLQFPPGPDKG